MADAARRPSPAPGAVGVLAANEFTWCFFLTGESSVRPSALSPLSFRVCPRCCLRRALPQAFSHFLGLMDAAAAQWQAGLLGPGVNSAPARPARRTCGCLGFQCTCRKVGHTVTLARQDTLPASARSELDRALSPVKCSWLYYTSFLSCFTTVSEPEVEICWVFYFFPCLPVKDSVLCHVLCHFCAVARLSNLLRHGVQYCCVPPEREKYRSA